jgi:hypothetical protein
VRGFGSLQAFVAQQQGTVVLMRIAAASDLAAAFVVSFEGFVAVLWMAWTLSYREQDAAGRKPGTSGSCKANA